jgi:urease accessory protein
MGYYASVNEVALEGRSQVVARERMVLDNLGLGHDTREQGSVLSPVARRLAPYHVYATALLYGPQLAPLRTLLTALSDRTSQFQVPCPPGLLWSYSQLGTDDQGGILRVAGTEVEDVRVWLREVMDVGGVRALVGDALWPRCI